MNYSKQSSDSKRTRNLILIVAAAAAALALCCCLALVVVLVLDPFQWDLIGRLTGKGTNPTAKAIPADAGIFMGVNLVNATPDKLDRVIIPFKNAAKEAGLEVDDTQSLEDQLNTQLEELGITIQDITPWIGQYVGLGIFDLSLDEYGTVEETHLVLAVEARNRKAADDFLVKLRDGLADQGGATFSEVAYEGVKMYLFEDGGQQLGFCRSKNLVLLGTGQADLEKAIQAQGSQSLNDVAGYKDLIKRLPSERALTMFVSSEQYRQLYASFLEEFEGGMFADISLEQAMALYWDEMAASFSIVEEGIQMDVLVSYDLANLTGDQRLMVQSVGGASKSVNMLPGDTLFFYGGRRLDLTWGSIRELAGQTSSQEDFAESMALFKQQFGFDPDAELFSVLDGEWMVGVFPDDEGLLVEAAELPLGFALLAQTSQPKVIQSTLSALNDSLGDQGFQVVEQQVKGQTVFDLSLPEQELLLFSYGLNGEYLSIGSSHATLEGMINQKDSLAQNLQFKQSWQSFPSAMQPVMYLNLDQALSLLREKQTPLDVEEFEQAMAFLEPIPSLTLAISPLDGNVVAVRLLVSLEQP